MITQSLSSGNNPYAKGALTMYPLFAVFYGIFVFLFGCISPLITVPLFGPEWGFLSALILSGSGFIITMTAMLIKE